MRELDIFNSEPRYVVCIDKYDTLIDNINYKRLEIGKRYFMTDIMVGNFCTEIWLKEFGEEWTHSFNSVLFGEVDD